MAPLHKYTKAELLAAVDKTVTDVIAPNLKILFCGINPGLYTAASGHHFARPGNRFWPTLYAAGFTERLLAPYEEQELLSKGYGITNLVARTTNAEAELSAAEFSAGAEALIAKSHLFTPRYIAILGIGAYRTGFSQPKARPGLQTEKIGNANIWILPNPSGLNAHYQLKDLAAMFQQLREHVETKL